MDSAETTITEQSQKQKDRRNELRRSANRRALHEFASFVVWHLSLTKPNVTAMRVLVNDLMQDWSQHEFSCGGSDCDYCNGSISVGFRENYRNVIGRNETERGRYDEGN